MMVTITPSPAELAAGRLSDANVAKAREAILRDGCVALQDVVSQESLDVLHEVMIRDLDLFLNSPNKPFNWVKGNVQQGPPPVDPYLFRDVLVNDFVIQATKSVLGPGLHNIMYGGNTAMPSESRQPAHADIGQLWPNQEVAHYPAMLVVNIPTVDVSAANGSTEIWLGTHLDTSVAMQDGDIVVAPDVLEARRAISPPLQPDIKRGTAVIRDVRMWHAGMPNRTENPRPMIAMIHAVSWWEKGSLPFPKGSEAVFEHPDLVTDTVFVEPDSLDYVKLHGGYAYEGK
ncbi:MAG: phytanoyl-CoA dioxygenase family protein, partial [bacterium]